MDQSQFEEINGYLVTIFNEVMMIEENALRQSQFSDLSIKEMHTIEAIGLTGRFSSSEVAEKLGVTVGTLSVSVQKLVKKDYVDRQRLPEDRRVVRLKLTNKGRLLYRLHRQFHLNMVEETIEDFDGEEMRTLIKGLGNLHCYLAGLKEQNIKGRKK